MRTPIIATLAVAGLTLAACQNNRPETGSAIPDGARATAALVNAAGASVGRATATEVAGGIRYTVEVNGLPAGTHGTHVHTTGRCDAPDFASAGGHWNPTGAKHGSMNPACPHAGDMPNMIVGTDGRGTVAVTVPGATMAGLLDADGATMMVHAGADDLMTDPSGNSGGRIACGVFTPA